MFFQDFGSLPIGLVDLMVNWEATYFFFGGARSFFAEQLQKKNNILDAIPNISQLNLDT